MANNYYIKKSSSLNNSETHATSPCTSGLLEMIRDGHYQAWSHFYNKYASLMHSIIFNLSGKNERISEQILTDLICELKDKSLLNDLNHSITSFLINYTKQYTLLRLQQYQLVPVAEKHDSVLNRVLHSYVSVSDTEAALNLSRRELQMKLREELLVARSADGTSQNLAV